MRTDTYQVKPNTDFVIAPLFGCNPISWKVDGKPVFYCPEGFARQPEYFYRGGNPVLFPSVGRTWDQTGKDPIFGQYRIYGHSAAYRMPIHGILPDGHFQKHYDNISSDRVEVEYKFTLRQTIHDADYPFDVRLALRYVLKARSMRLEAEFHNKDDFPAPFAFGYHPYFQLENRKGVQVHLPCKEELILDPELSIPTDTKPLTQSVITLDDSAAYDNVFSGMTGNRASIVDPKSGRTIHIDFDENIENLVMYAQPEQNYICLEPWTKGLGAFGQMNEPNWQDKNIINMLQPHETKTIQVTYSVEDA